jgi:transposase
MGADNFIFLHSNMHTLTNQQLLCIALLVYSPLSKKQIAKEIKVSERTVYNWFTANSFISEMRREQSKYFATIGQEATKLHTDLLVEAYKAHIELLNSEKPENRLKALKLFWDKYDQKQPPNLQFVTVESHINQKGENSTQSQRQTITDNLPAEVLAQQNKRLLGLIKQVQKNQKK